MRKPQAITFRNSRWWTIDEAREAFTAMRASGSLAEFAKREGLKPARLRSWEERVGSDDSLPRFVEVARTPTQVAGSPIDVALPSGVVLRVAESVGPEALGRIVEVLTSRGRC